MEHTSPLCLGGGVASPAKTARFSRVSFGMLETEATHSGAANPPFLRQYQVSMCGFAVIMVRGD